MLNVLTAFQKSATRWLQGRRAATYDSFVCTRAAVLKASPKGADARSRTVSVAIPHYRRGSLIYRPLFNLLNDTRVTEIVILDDGSPLEEYETLQAEVKRLDPAGKVRVHRRDQNCGALRTKIEVVALATGLWVVLLDSDNTVFESYLSALFALPQWDADTIYSSPFAFPFFSFAPIRGQSLDFARVGELCRAGTMKRLAFLNDGNYFVHRQNYSDTLAPLLHARTHAADVMAANYLWLSSGHQIRVLSSGAYCHRIETTSFWLRTAGASKDCLMSFYARLEAGQRWDAAFAASLLGNPEN